MKTPDQNDFNSVPAYNKWIDEGFSVKNDGELNILGRALRPSEILHRMGFDAYQAGFEQFKKHREESIIETVTEEFPIIIAHPFSRFFEGSENEQQRLQFLKDTWEGLINFVHALVVSEARAMKMTLVAPLRCSNILTDSLATRINNVEQILTQAKAGGVLLEAAKVVDLAVVSIIKDLNQTRNAFSHSGAPSEDQAKAYINECLDDVFDVLDGFAGLRNVKLIRYYQLDGLKVRYERFNGHATTKRYGDVPVTTAIIGSSAALLTRNESLILIGSKFISVFPLLHWFQQTSGHVTQVAFFKKTRGDAPNRKLLLEIVGESREYEIDRAPHQPAINEIRNLFGEPPEP